MQQKHLRAIMATDIFEQMSAMETRPEMYAHTPEVWFFCYDTLIRLLFIFNEESHNRFRNVFEKVLLKRKVYGNTLNPWLQKASMKDVVDLGREIKNELMRDT